MFSSYVKPMMMKMMVGRKQEKMENDFAIPSLTFPDIPFLTLLPLDFSLLCSGGAREENHPIFGQKMPGNRGFQLKNFLHPFENSDYATASLILFSIDVFEYKK